MGQVSACAVSRSELKCWGIDTNSYYGFVVNQVPEVNEPVLIAHSKSAQYGLDHACVLSFYDGVTCWGAGGMGALYKTEVPSNLNFDPDRDGHAAPHDAFPLDATEWLDTDRDGVGNNADDDDGDGMSDELELANGFNPLDSEDCPRWYCGNFPIAIIAVTSAAFDIDGDGLTRAQEESAGTNWHVADSDGDGLTDGDEVSRSSNPLRSDSDGDGLSDSVEVELGTSPILADTDGDSMSDAQEVEEGVNPTDGSDCPRWYCGGLNLPAIITADGT